MTDGKVKIAQVVGNAALGGVSTCVFNYFKYIDRSKVQFDFYVYAESGFDEKIRAIDPTARIFYIPSLIRFHKAVPAMIKLFRQNGYDAVHSHMTTLSAFVLYAAKRAKVPVRICHAHSVAAPDVDHKFVKKILRPFAVRYATHYMACGTDAAKYMYKKHWQDAVILKNAIELERFANVPERETAKEALGLEGKVFGFLGRFVYQKNLFFLIDSFALAATLASKFGRNYTLLLIGDGEDKTRLEEYIREFSCADRIRILPPTDKPEMYYAALDAFCLPSRYEGLPVVAIEAQAAGVPCLFSEFVTKECSLLPENEFLTLRDGFWVEAMQKKFEKSPNTVDILRAAGYDICEEAARLAAYYLAVCGEKS